MATLLPSSALVSGALIRLKRTRHGVMIHCIHDEVIGRSLDLYGEFSFEELKIFERAAQTRNDRSRHRSRYRRSHAALCRGGGTLRQRHRVRAAGFPASDAVHQSPRQRSRQCAGAASLIERILGLDYAAYWHRPYYYSPDNIYGNANNAFPGMVSVNMLCVPRGRDVSLDGLERITDPRKHPIDGFKPASS
jgi:hypothetical protein